MDTRGGGSPRGRIAHPRFAPAGDIVIGGNSFEVLFLAAADIFYREGSIYHAFTPESRRTYSRPY